MTPEEARKKERYGLVTVILELRKELDTIKADTMREVAKRLKQERGHEGMHHIDDIVEDIRDWAEETK